jgi:hypothetical protein
LAAAPSEVPVHEWHKEYRMDSGNVVFVAKKKENTLTQKLHYVNYVADIKTILDTQK